MQETVTPFGTLSQEPMPPSMDRWLREAKSHPTAPLCGMYFVHNGVVRQTARAKVRQGAADTRPVTGMEFDYDPALVREAIDEALGMEGIYYVRVWLAKGALSLGDDIMYVLLGGDIRPHVVAAFERLVGTIKNRCVSERERYEEKRGRSE